MSTAWLLLGAANDVSIKAVGEVNSGATSVRLALSAASSMTSPSYQTAQTPDSNNYVRWTVSGLTVNTRYYAALEIDGVIDTTWVNTFITDPSTPGQPGSFSCAFFSCAPGTGNGVSAALVHDRIADRQCTFNFHLGDFGYPNINANTPSLYRTNWKSQITGAHPALAWKAAAFHYLWDDHDFGPDNSDSTSPGRSAAAQVFREMFPIPTPVESGAIYHTFTKGRVRFIVTDERYYRDPLAGTTDATRSMFGATQKQWFKDQLLAADADPSILLTVWMSSQTPNMSSPPGSYAWGDYTTERAELWNFFAANGLGDSLIILAGDIHAMGYKVGVNYATSGSAPIRVYVSSPLEQSYPAGVGAAADQGWDGFSGATGFGGIGQYAVLTVTDLGTHINAQVDFCRVNATTGAESVSFSHSFVVGTPPIAPGIYAIRNDSGQRHGVLDPTGAQRYMVHS